MASLLDQVRDLASDDSKPLGSALLKAKVLAARLKHQPFAEWVNQELQGYPDEVALPDYRVLSVRNEGRFRGWDASGIWERNLEIALSTLPEKLQEKYAAHHSRQSVSALESLITGKENPDIMVPWPVELTAYMNGRAYKDLNLIRGWQDISKNQIIQLLVSVRSRLLDFVLRIEEENPNSGAALDRGEAPVPTERVANIFYTTIMRAEGNLAVGGSGVSQNSVVATGDLEGLLAGLRGFGLPAEAIKELQIIVSDAPKPTRAERVRAWLGGLATRASGPVIEGVGRLVAGYLGLPPA